MMKHILKYLLCAVVTEVAAVCCNSCTNDENVGTYAEDITYLNLAFDTRSGSFPSPEENGETGVASFRVFIYDTAGQLEFTQRYTASGGRIENPVIGVKPGVKTIYTVVNEAAYGVDGDDLTVKLADLSRTGVSNAADLEALIVRYTAYPRLSSAGLLMTGCAEGIMVAEGMSRNNPQRVVVEVTRNCARLDLKMQKGPNSFFVPVRLTKVEFFNGTDRQTLFEAADAAQNPAGAGYALTGVPYDDPTGTLVSTLLTNSGDSLQDIGTYYLPENLGAYTEESHGEASYVVLTYTINGQSEQSKIDLNRNAADGNHYNIVRNTRYVLSVTVNVGWTLDIFDWNDSYLDGDIRGSHIAAPGMVVMDWWALGQRFDRTIAFSSDGTLSVDMDDEEGNAQAIPSWLTIGEPQFADDGMSGTLSLAYKLTSDASHPDFTFRLRTGNIVKNIRVVYDNGYLPAELLPAAWRDNGAAGGVHLAKRLCLHPDQTQVSDTEVAQFILAQSGTVLPLSLSENLGDGRDNTARILEAASSDTAQSSLAAVCGRLGSSWYLPSLDEMRFIFSMNSTLGPSYAFSIGDESFLTSSTTASREYTWSLTPDNYPSPWRMTSTTYMRTVCNVSR